jgi:argininosuccinate lyase
MMTIKGIPSTYNKDLQESVKPMLELVKTLKDSLQIADRVLSSLTTFPDKMLAALTPDMLATDLAEYLVRKGSPSRFFQAFLDPFLNFLTRPAIQRNPPHCW